MKRQLHIFTIGLIVLCTQACATDEEGDTDLINPQNLAGTTWRSGSFPNTDVEYALLEFLSETRVEGLTKRQDRELEVDWNGVFEIVNDSIFVNYDSEALKGSIDRSKIIFTTDNSIQIRFIKQ